MAAEKPANPYVGPRPFERVDAPRFFGRAGEVRDVVSLVVAQRVLLLYAASGAGKSSLLNAGVLPVLEEEKGFDVLPVARLHVAEVPSDRNVFVAGLVSSLDASAPSLPDALERRLQPAGSRLRVLVVDQFEELLTLHPGRWHDRPGLFKQIAESLERDSGLRVVFAIREDFLAQLDPFAELLPGGLRTRFRLERLDRTCALAAVKNPLVGTGRSFAPGVAEALIDDLLRFRVDTGHGESEEVEGQYVEPVQLQVACSTLWADLPPDVREITSEHLRTYADVDQVLTRFYEAAVAAAARRSRRRERRIREWVGRVLITPGGTRGAAYAEAHETAGMPNDVVRVLEEKRVIRAEWRAGARWYELTHDRLLDPIRRSNARRAARRRRRLLQQTIAAAVAGIAVLGTVFGFSLGFRERPPAVERVVISALQVEPGVTWRNYLRRTNRPAGAFSPRRLSTVGAAVVFRVRFARGTRLRFETDLIDARTKDVLARNRFEQTPDAAAEVMTAWVPLPVKAESRTLSVRVSVFLRIHGGRPVYRLQGIAFVWPRCTITGTAGADVFVGTRGPDVLCGLGGRDRINGRGGSDSIIGGAGRDVLEGGSGDDVISARDGQPDLIDGGPGTDAARVDPDDIVRGVENIGP